MCLHLVLLRVAERRGGYIRERQTRPFPQKPWNTLAGKVQAFQVQRMQSRAQADGAAIIAHCIARDTTHLRKGGACLCYFDAVDRRACAIPRQKVKVYPPSTGTSSNPSHAVA